jgi:hypothetical protein
VARLTGAVAIILADKNAGSGFGIRLCLIGRSRDHGAADKAARFVAAETRLNRQHRTFA